MPRLRNLFIDPRVVLKRDEPANDTTVTGSLLAPAREMDVHVAGLACTSI